MRHGAWLTACAGCVAMLAAVGGCAKPASGPNPVTVASDDFDAIFTAAREALRRHHFEEDRLDRRAGVLTTLPSTTGDFWEVWRRDTADAEGRTMAALGTVRKIVTVQIAKTEAGGHTVAVTVVAQRRQLPTVDPTTTSEAYSIFNPERTLLFESLTLESRQRAWERREIAWWADIGRDTALEQALLTDIGGRLGVPAAP